MFYVPFSGVCRGGMIGVGYHKKSSVSDLGGFLCLSETLTIGLLCWIGGEFICFCKLSSCCVVVVLS